MKIKSNKLSKVAISLITLAVIAIIGLGAFIVYTLFFQTDTTETDTTKPTTDSKIDNDINYDAPTDEEVDESQNAKKEIINKEEEPQEPTSNVEVGIANYFINGDDLEIRAFTPSVVEGGGICTATLTRDNLTVTGESEAFVDATTSQCRPIIIPVSKFKEKGLWQLIVTYKSDKYTGTSPVMGVDL